MLSGRFNSSVGSSTAAAIAKKALPSCLQLVLTHHAEARQGYFSFRQNANAQDNKRSAGSRSMRKDDQPPALLRGEDGQLRVPVPTTRASCFERPGGSVRGERANITGLVLNCIEAKFCKEILVGIRIYLKRRLRKRGRLKKENMIEGT